MNSYVCPNASCRRTFARPLKTVVVGTPLKPFEACPYCLTEIGNNTEKSPLSPNELTAEPSASHDEKHTQTAGNATCSRHFGYLSERGAKDPIPDDCLTCMEIVQCMLKKAKEQVGDT